MDGASGEFDAIFQSLPLGFEARKGRKQRRMNVQYAVWEGSHKVRRQETHVASQADQIHLVIVQDRDDLAVISLPLQSLRREHASGNAASLGAIDAGRALAVADDDGDFRARNSAGGDVVRERLEIRTAAAQEHA